MVVPARRFDLHVLADHIVTQLLGLYDVERQRLVRRSGIESVGPPALIQRTELEQRFVVQFQTYDVVFVAADREFAHRRVALHLVHLPAVAHQRHFHIVEERRCGTPQLRLRHVQLHGRTAERTALGYLRAVVVKTHFDHVARLRAAGGRLHAKQFAVEVGRGSDVPDVLLRHGFEPYRLPDAAHGGVPDAFGTVHLLAAGLAARVGGVPHAYLQLVVALLERRRDVEFEGREAAGVRSHADAVHPNVGFPVHCAEVQQHAFAVPFRGDREGAVVPEFVPVAQTLADP